MSTLQSLESIKKLIAAGKERSKKIKETYTIPSLWIAPNEHTHKPRRVTINPYDFFSGAVDAILSAPAQKIKTTTGGMWTRNAVIYNMFVRTTCAFDHNGNGKIDLPQNTGGWKETGTFLKAIALLPYIRSLGANTIHLLPVTSIGKDGNKGTLGSPYAMKNPYELDPNLHEPNIGAGAKEEFKAFVEAAHHLGMRVVAEFVFRTSAKDSDWVKEHPDWFYWIKASVPDRQPHSHDESAYGAPVFTHDELQRIHAKVGAGDFGDLLSPHANYREMFTEVPKKQSIKLIDGKWIGTTADGAQVRIPGAFADWPPDDSQPPWSDVTYLKMYTHPDFNYIAYNTLRMYDTRLTQQEHINTALWEKIANIIPHYQQTFGIDGVMIDMGHALPMALKQDMINRARTIDPDFAFWDENFSISQQSVTEGYNAVVGYQWADQHHPSKFKTLLKRFSEEGYAIPFFATPESHNTPRAAARAGGIIYSKYAWAINAFIPAIPFIHSGFELGESFPINTGLDFTKEELKHFPSEKLPLFSEYAYNWLKTDELIVWMKKISAIREKFGPLVLDSSPPSFIWIETHHHDVIAFIRSQENGTSGLLVVANSNMHQGAHCMIEIHGGRRSLHDMLSGTVHEFDHHNLRFDLSKGQVTVFEL